MKKVNKALMATVAILLSLVLISTSVLSGVFAKFVETKSAGATVSLKAFGLTLTVDKGSSASSVTYSPTDSNSTTALSVTVPITINAATDYDDIVKFTLSGTPNVDNVKLVLKINTSGVDNFYFSGTADKKIPAGYHIPMVFMTQVFPDDTVRQSSSGTFWTYLTENETLENRIIAGIYDDITKNKNSSFYKNNYHKNYDISCESNTLEMEIWNEKKVKQVDALQFGVRPYNYVSGDAAAATGLTRSEAAILQTYIAESEPSLTITYTVSLEQVIPTTTNS